MNSQDFEKYLKERYYPQIDWYDKKAVQNKHKYTMLQWGLIILSAITPIIIALDLVKPIPIIISSFVAILTTGIKTFKFQENWINYRTTCETLKKEIHFYSTGIDDYTNIKDKEAKFVERVESLISRENTLWLTISKNEVKE
jgi:hypothetical protein